MMAWIVLVLAGLFEIAGVLGINLWNKRRDWRSFCLMAGGFTVSFVLLMIAMQTISMGTAYAIWTAIGTVGGTLVGMLYYGESHEWRRIFFLTLVVASAVGLKLIG
jgi:paired small multidrug resistance pump